MKLIIAVIKPFKLEEVREALTAVGRAGPDGVRGQGLRPAVRAHRDLPRRRVRGELRAEDPARAGGAGRLGRGGGRGAGDDGAKTGKIGDGKIFVLDVEQAMRVRTGETGDEAL